MKTVSLIGIFMFAILGIAKLSPEEAPSKMQKELDIVAHVGSAMVDGDICQKIVTQRARELMFASDPRDRFLAGDNYDVDDVAFNTVKKTLIRLSHLSSFPADVNLWMPIEGHAGKIQLVIRNKNEMSQFWNWGELYGDIVPQMETVLKTGQRVTVTNKPGWISVLAPVYNSLGDVVGLIETVSQVKMDAHENVK
ncbi:MAG TPA: hypothetical protein VK937_20825 [Candidatus Limnocylindria bacterium]|jgi:hypothetical protein|nr:hypothetical protein [Candidatus Limnocylindria bacterium]HTG27464.1 hypothetical protein [Methylomirabilota bacterium]